MYASDVSRIAECRKPVVKPNDVEYQMGWTQIGGDICHK